MLAVMWYSWAELSYGMLVCYTTGVAAGLFLSGNFDLMLVYEFVGCCRFGLLR